MSQLDELRKEADDLGISYGKTLGADRLQAKIDEFYEQKETSGAQVEQAVVEKEKQAETKPVKAKAITNVRVSREKEARETRIVTIIDNDQRVNNNTTTCTVNCSNEYFDLGTIILPLNEKIEVMQGHLNVLAEVRIPQHIKDAKTGLATVKMRNRYTIANESVKKQ